MRSAPCAISTSLSPSRSWPGPCCCGTGWTGSGGRAEVSVHALPHAAASAVPPPWTCLKATTSLLQGHCPDNLAYCGLAAGPARATAAPRGRGPGGRCSLEVSPLQQGTQPGCLFLSRVLSLQDLCCRAVVSCTPVHLVDKLPLPIALRSHLKSFSMANGLNARMMHGRSFSLTAGAAHTRKGLRKGLRSPQSPPQNCPRNSCKIS